MTKRTTPKRKYTPEFKAEALRLASAGQPTAEVARNLGIPEGLLYSWQAAEKKKRPAARDENSLLAEVQRLRRELRQTQTERDILKKAVGIFSQPT